MIMFYDVLLIDDKPVLHQPYRQRRELLEELATRIKGRADLVWQSHVDFSTPKGPKRLKKALAHAFVHRWEGLVLKPSDEPYFNTGKPVQGKYPSRWIKLKKDCIKGLGDTADFAVIGAGYDVTEAAKYEGLNIRWTHFYVGCLVNKQAVLHKDEKPQFFIFEKISDCIKKEDLKTLTENGYLRAVDPKSLEASELFDIQYASGLSPMLTMFKRPFVFDIAGSGFDKSPNREIFTLRFPRVMKIRWDRDWTEAVSLNELQEMAMEARTTPSGDLSQEIVQWIAKLDQLDRGAKGQMTSWDSSGDEKEHCNFENDEVTSKPKASRHARDSAAPPLVRMDTGEMREPERRLRNGEVVERPVSKLSIESLTSDGFLQTPPKSSPLSSRKDPQSARQEQRVSIAASSGRSKKRAVDFVGLEEAAGWPEKPEVGVEQPSKGNIKPSSSVRPAAHKQPLSEISNSARRAFRPQIAEAYQQQHTAVPGLSLERNIAFGAEIKSLRGQGKRRRLMEPSSPSIETTASSSTILSTAPRTIYHQPKPPSPKCPSKDQCKPSSFLTPPSTDQPRRIPKLPTLQECDVMVAPLTTENRHYLDRLIRSSTISPIPFPEASLPRQLVGERDSKVKANTITLLLDTDDTVTTGRQIWSLLPHLSHCHPRSVTAWDWRILSLMDKQETGEGDEKRRLMTDWFYAKLSWVPGSGTSGAVEVEWRDGEISRVLREEFEHVGD